MIFLIKRYSRKIIFKKRTGRIKNHLNGNSRNKTYVQVHEKSLKIKFINMKTVSKNQKISQGNFLEYNRMSEIENMTKRLRGLEESMRSLISVKWGFQKEKNREKR